MLSLRSCNSDGEIVVILSLAPMTSADKVGGYADDNDDEIDDERWEKIKVANFFKNAIACRKMQFLYIFKAQKVHYCERGTTADLRMARTVANRATHWDRWVFQSVCADTSERLQLLKLISQSLCSGGSASGVLVAAADYTLPSWDVYGVCAEI